MAALAASSFPFRNRLPKPSRKPKRILKTNSKSIRTMPLRSTF
jgi:hypothetical protein